MTAAPGPPRQVTCHKCGRIDVNHEWDGQTVEEGGTGDGEG